jgi:DNA recombination protein RmuC
MESPDFVLMFVPMEPAFAIALQQDSSLFSNAFDRNIVIVTPTTLLATLRTIDSMWTNEKQRQNALEIARVAGGMYDKFVNFSENLVQVGLKMDAAKSEYVQAMSRLTDGRGNLVSSAERLKKLGAKAKKSLPDSILERASESLNPNE